MDQKIKAGFVYLIQVFNPDGTEDPAQREIVKNLMPTEGINHMLDVLLKNGVNVPTWYIGLYANNYTPIAGDTMATFPGTAGEITGTYDEATRVEWVEGAIAGGAVDNTASPAEFTFNANQTVRGGFMSSVSTKGGTSGFLISAVKFASPKNMTADGVLRVSGGFTVISA
jgi:hypothetical protein